MLFIDQWRAIDEEALGPERGDVQPAARYKKKSRRTDSGPVVGPYDWRPLVVLMVAAIALTVSYYLGNRPFYRRFYSDVGGDAHEFGLQAWQAGWHVISYIVIPVLAILLMPGERLRDYFLSIRGALTQVKTCAILFAALLPLLYVLAQFSAIREQYPIYRLHDSATFDPLIWVAIALVKIAALEFFFRGFMLKGLAASLGSLSIFIMVVPYTMIRQPPHYTIYEALFAIVVAIVLGTFAMRAKSIWGGFVLHAAVVLCFDALVVAAS